MRKNVVIVIIIFGLFESCILSFFKPLNPVDTSIGGSSIVSDFTSMLNPANVENIYEPNIYAVYTNLYNTEDVYYSGVYFVYPSFPHFFGINTNLLMFSNVYYETLTVISYGHKIKNFVIGTKLKSYYAKLLSDFDFVAKELYVVDVDIGMSYTMEKFVIGLLLENVLKNKYRFVDQDVSQQLKYTPYIGLKYSVFDEIKIFLQKNISEVDKLKLCTGVQVEFKNQLFLRAGVNETNLFSFGFGIAVSKLKLDFSTTFNELLGYNFIFGVGCRL